MKRKNNDLLDLVLVPPVSSAPITRMSKAKRQRQSSTVVVETAVRQSDPGEDPQARSAPHHHNNNGEIRHSRPTTTSSRGGEEEAESPQQQQNALRSESSEEQSHHGNVVVALDDEQQPLSPSGCCRSAMIAPSQSPSASSSSSSSAFDLDFDGLCPALFREFLEHVLPAQEAAMEQFDSTRGIVTRTFQDHGVRLVFRVPRQRRSTTTTPSAAPPPPSSASSSSSSSSPFNHSPSRAVLSTVTLHLEVSKHPDHNHPAAHQQCPCAASSDLTTASSSTQPNSTTAIGGGGSFSTLADHQHRHPHRHLHCFQTTLGQHDSTTVPIRQAYTGPLPPNLAAGHTSMAGIRAHSHQMGWTLIGCDDGDDTWPDPSACNPASATAIASSSSSSLNPLHNRQIVAAIQPLTPSSPNSYSHEQRSFPALLSSIASSTTTSSSSTESADSDQQQHSSQRRVPIFERYSPREGDFLAEVFYADQDCPRVTTVISHRRRVVSEFTRANFQKRKTLYDQCFGEYVGIRQDIHPPYIDVLIYKRKFASGTEQEQEFYTLITNGMSDIPMATPNTVGSNGSVAELVMYVREPHERYVHLLQYLACYPHDENTWLGHGHTISWPHKLHVASELQHFLIATPILRQDRQFRKILSMDGAPVNLLWVLPITNAERNFKRARGTAPLLDLFSTSGEFHWILDERRKSLA